MSGLGNLLGRGFVVNKVVRLRYLDISAKSTVPEKLLDCVFELDAFVCRVVVALVELTKLGFISLS